MLIFLPFVKSSLFSSPIPRPRGLSSTGTKVCASGTCGAAARVARGAGAGATAFLVVLVLAVFGVAILTYPSFSGAPLPQVAARVLRGGRERGTSLLARADTPHRDPVALVDVAGIQATTIVAQEVLVAAIARGSRPPVAEGASTVERATAVVPTKDRRESG